MLGYRSLEKTASRILHTPNLFNVELIFYGRPGLLILMLLIGTEVQAQMQGHVRAEVSRKKVAEDKSRRTPKTTYSMTAIA